MRNMPSTLSNIPETLFREMATSNPVMLSISSFPGQDPPKATIETNMHLGLLIQYLSGDSPNKESTEMYQGLVELVEGF